MKIIFDKPGADIEAHAVHLVNDYRKRSKLPFVSSVHAAQEPEVCEDCGITYWHTVDKWTSHRHCKGEHPPERVQFGFIKDAPAQP